MFKKFCFALSLITLPVFASAEVLGGTKAIFESVSYLVGMLIPIAFALALLFFFYGVAKYIWTEGQGKAEGKQIMIWGVVALVVMSSIWGIVYFINTELGIDGNKTNMTIPTIK